jgi:hypothetical protein
MSDRSHLPSAPTEPKERAEAMTRYVAKHFDEKGRDRGEDERALAKLRESKTAPVPAGNSQPSEHKDFPLVPADFEEITKVNEQALENWRKSSAPTLPQPLTPQQIEELRARHEQWAKERESPGPRPKRLLSILIIWGAAFLFALLLWISAHWALR